MPSARRFVVWLFLVIFTLSLHDFSRGVAGQEPDQFDKRSGRDRGS
jgi:hypothetical protein